MTPIISFLKSDQLPSNKAEASKIRAKAARFIIINNVLYIRGYSPPYQHYVTAPEAKYMLKEIHEDICGNHVGARSLVGKALRAGYYWPTLQKGALHVIQT